MKINIVQIKHKLLMAKKYWAYNLEATLDANIERQVNPPILQGLPWQSDETE